MADETLKLANEIIDAVEPKTCACKEQCQWHAGMSKRAMDIIKKYLNNSK